MHTLGGIIEGFGNSVLAVWQFLRTVIDLLSNSDISSMQQLRKFCAELVLVILQILFNPLKCSGVRPTFLLCPIRGEEYCDQFVCVCVCLRAYWTDLHENFCADPLWLWLSPLVALRYVVHFRFYG